MYCRRASVICVRPFAPSGSVEWKSELKQQLTTIQAEPALDAPVVRHQPRLEHWHADPFAGGREVAQRTSVRAGGGEPRHQVVAVDHQVLDAHVKVGESRQPGRQRLARGRDAGRLFGRVVDDITVQELVQLVELAVIEDALDEATVQGSGVMRGYQRELPSQLQPGP